MNEKKEYSTDSKVKQVLQNKQLAALVVAVVALLAGILISTLALKITVVPVCVILLLEVGIACCLHHEPIWLHGIVLLAELIAGILCKQILFIVLCAVIYVVAIFVLKYMKEA